MANMMTTVTVNLRILVDDAPLVSWWRIRLLGITARLLGVPLRLQSIEKASSS